MRPMPMMIKATPPTTRIEVYVKIDVNAEVSVRPALLMVLAAHMLVTTPMKARKLPAITQSHAIIL